VLLMVVMLPLKGWLLSPSKGTRAMERVVMLFVLWERKRERRYTLVNERFFYSRDEG